MSVLFFIFLYPIIYFLNPGLLNFYLYFPSFCISLNVFLGTTVSNVCLLTGFSADFDEINDLGHDKMILTLQAPIPQNGQTPSNNSSATADELLPTNCLSVFDHFVKLAFKGLTNSVRLFLKVIPKFLPANIFGNSPSDSPSFINTNFNVMNL